MSSKNTELENSFKKFTIMSKAEKGKDKTDKKSPQKNLKQKRAEKANKRAAKKQKGLDNLKK